MSIFQFFVCFFINSVDYRRLSSIFRCLNCHYLIIPISSIIQYIFSLEQFCRFFLFCQLRLFRRFYPYCRFSLTFKFFRLESRLKNDGEIAKFKRDFDFTKASYDVEVNAAKAAADLAYPLQAALMQQKIKEEETQVKVVERKQEIEVQEHEIFRYCVKLEFSRVF